ncbi:MAG: hypothetical protein KF882_05095 [Bacteroidia bacterium]|nr:hypothetical protein [Bacteroidia bacterium]MCO5253445.1 hypothetical protein [Bacteroidota bacterium]
MKNFWLAISFLLHPLLLILYSYAILFYFLPYYQARFYDEDRSFLLLFIFTNIVLIPVIMVLLLQQLKLIKSIYLKEQRERTLPYLLTSALCAVSAWQIMDTNLGELSYRFLFGVSALIFIIAIINFWFKISSHAAAIAGVVGMLLYTIIGLNEGVMIYWLVPAILLAGLSASSRLALGAHNFKEIYCGFLLGFCVIFLSVAL